MLPLETCSAERDVAWRDRGSSRMTIEQCGVLEARSGAVELGDAAREGFFHETSLVVPCPRHPARVELAVVRWDDDGLRPLRVAALTLWWTDVTESVDWMRVGEVPIDSSVGLVVDPESDEALAPLAYDVWERIMPTIDETGVHRSGGAVLFDCGTAGADFPVWEGRTHGGELAAVRISTMLLDDSMVVSAA